MTVAALILAAGASQRLGRPKQDVVLDGRSLLQRAVDVALQTELFPVLVVLRAGTARSDLPGTQFVWNTEAPEGMGSSVRAGVAALETSPDVTGTVVMTCDQPMLTVAHVRNLLSDPDRITGSAYAGRIGVPAFFPARSFPQLGALQGDAGARHLLQGSYTIRNEALALDIDTEADVSEAERLFATRSSGEPAS